MVRSRYETIISFPEPWTKEDCPGIENGRSGDTDLDRESAFSHYGLLYKKIVDLRLFLVRPFWLFDRPFLKISDIDCPSQWRMSERKRIRAMSLNN